MTQIICAAVCGVLALIALALAVRSFMEKGFLFNNAYIWASKQERETMDKKPHYRQTAVAFSLISAIFLLMAVELVLQTDWLWIGYGALCLALLVYAVVSSVKQGGGS